MEIDGLIAPVTGGGSGLGAATAAALAGHGCRVAVLDLDQDAADSVAATVGGLGLKADVADVAEVEAAFARTVESSAAPRESWSIAPGSELRPVSCRAMAA